jgi:hypothetical protein
MDKTKLRIYPFLFEVSYSRKSLNNMLVKVTH